jgi:hypothetical protein
VPFSAAEIFWVRCCPVRHQNSVFPISTNSSKQIWKSVFLIRLSQLNVRFPDFKIRLNIRLYEYINMVWRNTKCYSKIGVITFWNAVSCHLPSFLPFRFPKQQVPAHLTPPTESLLIYGDVCGSSTLDSIVDFVWMEKEGMAGMCFAPAKESFSSLEVSRTEVQGATALIKFGYSRPQGSGCFIQRKALPAIRVWNQV